MFAYLSLGNTSGLSFASTAINDNVCTGSYTLIDDFAFANNYVATYRNVVTSVAVPSVTVSGLPGSSVGGSLIVSRYTGFTGTPTLAASEVAKVNGSLTGAIFDGTLVISSNVLTITTFSSGTLSVGDVITGTDIPVGTTCSSYGTGTGTSTGTYNMSANATATVSTAEAMTSGTLVSGPALTTSQTPELLVAVFGSTLGNVPYGVWNSPWNSNTGGSFSTELYVAVTAAIGTPEQLTVYNNANSNYAILNAGFYNGAPLSSPGPLPRSIFIMP